MMTLTSVYSKIGFQIPVILVVEVSFSSIVTSLTDQLCGVKVPLHTFH